MYGPGRMSVRRRKRSQGKGHGGDYVKGKGKGGVRNGVVEYGVEE